MIKASRNELTFATASPSLPLAISSFTLAFEERALVLCVTDKLVARIADVVAFRAFFHAVSAVD